MVKLNNQSKQEHFDSLSPFLDSKPFWKSCKLYFSNKHSFGDSFSTGHFSQIFLMTNCKISFSNHPGIIKIMHKFRLSKKLSSQCVFEATVVRKLVKSLPSDIATAGEIPVNVLKNSEICFYDLTTCISKAIRNNMFPDSLKLVDVTPVYKKLDPSAKANYRPVSVLPLLSKVIYDQLHEYLENFLSELLFGSQKAHSMQHAFFRLIQRRQAERDTGGLLVQC